MAKVFLVRHAMPQLDATASPDDWRLSGGGRAAARALRGRLPPRSRRVVSSERKAQETLALALDEAFEVDRRLDEVHRPREPIDSAVRSARRAWVSGRFDERHDGWETVTDAAARFDAAVRARASADDLVVATHGMVLTAWLVFVGTVEAGEAAASFWESLGLPDVVTVDL